MAIYGLCECLKFGVTKISSASCVAHRSLSNRTIELRLRAASRHAYDVPGGVTCMGCDNLQEKHHVVGTGLTQAKSQWFCCHCFHFVRACLRRTDSRFCRFGSIMSYQNIPNVSSLGGWLAMSIKDTFFWARPANRVPSTEEWRGWLGCWDEKRMMRRVVGIWCSYVYIYIYNVVYVCIVKESSL